MWIETVENGERNATRTTPLLTIEAVTWIMTSEPPIWHLERGIPLVRGTQDNQPMAMHMTPTLH